MRNVRHTSSSVAECAAGMYCYHKRNFFVWLAVLLGVARSKLCAVAVLVAGLLREGA